MKQQNEIAIAHLEEWMRDHYFTTEIDIGSSGVENFSFVELRQLLSLNYTLFDQVTFDDSPSCGSQELRNAIAKRWGDGNPEKVMATHGSSEVIYLILKALLREGDEVVTLSPCYHALHNIAESIGCKLKIWPLRFDQNFIPDLDELAHLITPQTRMVIANFPHNPTGTTLTDSGLESLIKVVSDVGAYLLWDGAFSEITYDNHRLANPALLYDRAIVLGTLSKGYGLAGLRVGWCIAPEELLAGFVHWRDYTTLYLSPLVEFIAQQAIEKADVLLKLRLDRAYTNLQIVKDWVAQHQGMITWVPPSGGVTAFPRLCNVGDVDAFCRQLSHEYGTMVVPGSCFNEPNHIRLGFGGPTDKLKEGLIRLSKHLTATIH